MKNIDNLIIEHLENLRSEVVTLRHNMQDEFKEVKNRLSMLEVGQSQVMQHIGHLAGTLAGQQITLALDDDLIAKAQIYTGIEEKTALVREALKALIQREAAKRLANLGGSQPGIQGVPRRRPEIQ